jgi:SPP1 gp7 family putative phage head morphogenesis protein
MPPPIETLSSDVAERSVAAGSANDTIVDLFMQRAVDILRLESGTTNKVVELLDQLEIDIVAAIAKIDPTGTTADSYQQGRLVKLQGQVEADIQAAYRSTNTLMASETRDVADKESTWTANAINYAVRADFADVGLTRGELSALASDVLIQGAASKDWWSRQAQGLADRFGDEMRRGIALGETNAQLIDRVRGTKDTTGLMDVSRVSATRLVRASVQAVANAARTATYDDNADLISAVQWHSVLDTRTSEWCIARDGCQYDVKTHEPIDDAPPWLEGPGALHWGCRSTSIPVLKSWRDIGIDADEVPHTTRAAMDGQVAASTTFESWLNKQSAARQDTVLGEGKAALWRAGKITLRDLLDQNGRPLTTEQLRDKYDE